MSTIITRASKGAKLTWEELDANFDNLNTNKVEAADVTTAIAAAVGVSVQAYDADLSTWAGVTPANGVATFLATPSSVNLKTAVTDETGSGALVFANTPTLVTPVLGTPTSGNLANCTGYPVTPQVQIQPISASVGSNALTISASALSLDFRSTSLTSGTVTTVSGTPSNLVISSGSTLGTINATQSRIVVLALNNAGTIELAAVNIAGGNDLTETGVISTTAEGGAGAADSASVVYSATARTNVAYRVIGYIESTQATAGTWATAASTIQGAGGNAATAMLSLGYGQKWTDVTGSRAKATTYYNTTGKPIIVNVSCTEASTNNYSTLTVGGLVVANNNMANGAGVQTATISVIVPPGNSYIWNDSVGTATLTAWLELR